MIRNLRKLSETKINKQGFKMWIIEFKNNSKILVQFETGGTRWSMYDRFEKGTITNPDIVLKNKINAYYGNKYNSIEFQSAYRTWSSIIQRCNSKYIKNNRPTYELCEICDEWLNFDNFVEWYKNNYYEVEGERMDLDKDILAKGNKVYSPETCIFVPQRINALFTKRQNDRGKYPIGVTYNKRSNKFIARCNKFNLKKGKKIRISLGYFNSPEEAFYSYKQEKEKYIKEVADEYKDKIPKKLYDAMYRYEVEITD